MTLRTNRLAPNTLPFIIVSVMAAFLTYSSMYAVRKAFVAGVYADYSFLGVDYKIWLITAQVIGYTISKFLGIAIVAEVSRRMRPRLIIILVAISIIALLLFAITPPPYGIVFLFVNGLPIGMIFGLVFNYLEGRRTTEILVVGLTVTQVFSSGLIKTIGRYLVDSMQMSEMWMPFIVGIGFFPLLLLGVFVLEYLPSPSTADINLKSVRTPMASAERKRFLATFFWGLIVFIGSYILLTAYRDYRDNFAVEIWNGLGINSNAALLSLSEIPAALVILAMMIWLHRVKNNPKAFKLIHLIAIGGGAIAMGSTILFGMGWISSLSWIICTSIGLYIAYVPANTIFFERMFAVFRYPGNASFVVTMADFFGYCGSVAVMLYKNFNAFGISYAAFFYSISILVPALLIVMELYSLYYFFGVKKREQKAPPVIITS